MNIERWAVPLFKSVGLVSKSSKTIARSQIKCASCEICSYHLGLESPDLSPPFKDMYICDVCNLTYDWQCLLKTSCYNAIEREAVDANDSWACPACFNLNQIEKDSRILYSQTREIMEVSWNPTWEPEELQNTCESFKQSLKKFEEQITAPNLPQPAPEHYGHRALWVLDHNHWSHGVSRKEYPILPRWHYASWSVHWHSNLYL